MTFKSKIGAVALGLFAFAGSANATIATIYDSVTNGQAIFNSTVTGAGGTVAVDTWTSMTDGYAAVSRGDYTITRNNGGALNFNGYGSLSGEVVSIGPAVNSGSTETSGTRLSPELYSDAGITFTFTNAINSIGFEVGDWATCCTNPTTDLFISFDGGAPILVATASNSSDGYFQTQTGGYGYEIFVAAFDDSGTFNTVTFWGNGIGEVLYAGAEVRYALLDEGTVPEVLPTVPLPAGGLLLLGGLGALGIARRRKS